MSISSVSIMELAPDPGEQPGQNSSCVKGQDQGVRTVRGNASNLLLAQWHRRGPSTYVVDGDRALVAAWPHI